MDLSAGVDPKRLEAIFEECDLARDSSERKRQFCLAYFDCDYNAAEAARMCGYEGEYAGQVGWRYSQEPKIRKALGLLSVEFGKKNDLRVDFVMKKMLQGVEKAEKAGNLTAMARFIEMIGKHLGMFKEQVELTGKDGKAIEIEQRTREDVESFKSAIDGLAKRGGSRETPIDTKH